MTIPNRPRAEPGAREESTDPAAVRANNEALASWKERMAVEGSRYQPVMFLGEGGMAQVFLATTEGAGGFRKVVVLKCLKRDLAADREMVETFLNEARLMARMNHPNVVQVLDVTTTGGVPAICMEYLAGQPLDLVRSGTLDQLPLDLHLFILAQTLRGLEHFHDLKDATGTPTHPVHRDVSPQNIFVTYEGEVKVLDFGIAKVATQGSADLTDTGSVKGKLRYMAPEQLLREPLDLRTDLFAVGLLLAEALTQRRFWKGMPESEVIRHLALREVPKLDEARLAEQSALHAVATRALQPFPEERYPSAGSFRDALLSAARAANLLGDGDQLRAHMNDRFGHEADRQRARVARRLEGIADRSSLPPMRAAFPSTETTQQAPRTDESLATLRAPQETAATRAEGIAPAVPARVPPRRAGWRWLLPVAATAAIALLAMAKGPWSRSDEKRPPVTATTPGASATPGTADSTPQATSPDAAPLIGTSSPRTASSGSLPCARSGFLDDFEDGDAWLCNNDGHVGQWVTFFDGTGTLQPPPGVATIVPLKPARGSSHYGIRLQGSKLGDWGAGIAVALAEGRNVDVSRWHNISVWLSSPRPLFVELSLATRATLSTAYGGDCEPTPALRCDDHFGITRVIGPNWVFVEVPVNALAQRGTGAKRSWNPKEVVELHIRLPRRREEPPLSFDLSVDDVQYY